MSEPQEATLTPQALMQQALDIFFKGTGELQTPMLETLVLEVVQPMRVFANCGERAEEVRKAQEAWDVAETTQWNLRSSLMEQGKSEDSEPLVRQLHEEAEAAEALYHKTERVWDEQEPSHEMVNILNWLSVAMMNVQYAVQHPDTKPPLDNALKLRDLCANIDTRTKAVQKQLHDEIGPYADAGNPEPECALDNKQARIGKIDAVLAVAMRDLTTMHDLAEEAAEKLFL